MRDGLIQFGAPLLTALFLTGMTAGDKLRVDPHEADAYHERAAAAIAAVPKVVRVGGSTWFGGKEMALSEDAESLLHPNAYIHRNYLNVSTSRRVELLLVQCRDTDDMQGHYPPICYPSSGCSMDSANAQIWHAGVLSVDGTEYVITRPSGERTTIRNFFILPNGKIVRDMESVNAAAKDYRELVYGVAQVQLLFDASVGGAERDQIFAQWIGSNQDLIASLRNGNMGRKK